MTEGVDLTSRRRPPPARIYRREAYPVGRPGATSMTHDEAKWALWSDGNDYVVNTGGEVRLFVGDITWREVPFDPADRGQDPVIAHQWSVRYPDGFVDQSNFTEAGARQRATELGGEVVYRAVGPWVEAVGD